MDAFATALQHPETVDVAALPTEREQHEMSDRNGGIGAQVGLSIWQIVVIVVSVIVGLITFGALIQ